MTKSHSAWKKKHNSATYNDMYWESAGYQKELFYIFRDSIIALAMTRYKWVNLPETCDARFLEETLLYNGYASIAYPLHKKKYKGVFFSTEAVFRGAPNIYYNPRKWDSFGINGWRFAANNSTGTIIFDNMTRFPLVQKINMWTRELVDILRTKQLNRMHQKVPFLLVGPQEKELDMLNIFKQIIGGEQAVITTDGIRQIDIEAIQTGVQFLGKELNEDFRNCWNNIYMELGIKNLPFKTERQIQDEVTDLTEPSTISALSGLQCRRKGADYLNKHFAEYLNAPISVVWNVDVQSENYRLINSMSETLDKTDGELLL